MSFAAAAAVALLVAGASAPSGADAALLRDDVPRLTADERARLARGETLTWPIPLPGNNQRAGVAARLVPGDPERVARAIGDVDHWSEWVPYLESSARSATPGPASRELRFDLPWPLRDRHYRARLQIEEIRAAGGGPGESGPLEWTLRWESVPDSGNVEWARGWFRVEDYDTRRSLVVFRSATDVETPRFARSLLDQVVEDSLLWVLDGLAQQVERCRYTVPYPDGCRETRPSTP